MFGMVTAHTELEYHLKEFESARIRRNCMLARQGHPIRPPGPPLGPLLFLALKCGGLVQLYRLALDGGVLR